MKRLNARNVVTNLFAVALLGTVTGCMEDSYNPNTETKLPPKEDFFDFNLTGDVQLSVNYDLPGLRTIIEVYDQNPMMSDTKTKKEGLNPIYVAYVNDGKYQGTMPIPTAVKEAYLYAHSISVPACVKLNVVGNGFEFDATKKNEANTRMNSIVPTPPSGLLNYTKLPYEVASEAGGKRSDNLYSIGAWIATGWATLIPNYYQIQTKIGVEGESVGNVATRINEFLSAQKKIDKNESLLRNPEQINMRVPDTATDGMSVEVTHMGEHCSFFNTFGYYYYKDNGKTLTPEEFWNIKKYIVVPCAKTHAWGSATLTGAVQVGETVKLWYFDENGNKLEKFPAGYVIGWFLISNGFGNNAPAIGVGGNINNGKIKDLPADAYTSASKYSKDRYTCMSDDKDGDRRFISLYDRKSKLRVIGIEDYTNASNTPDDYMDLLFVVKTTPDLGEGELPPINSDGKPEPADWSIQGTLAFEDIWPNGGDYDLNDVVIEYNRVAKIGADNKVTSIKETFKPVQKDGSATYDNFFACQYSKPGKMTLPAGVISESSTNSIVIEASAKTIAGNSYIIERDLSGLNLDQEGVKKDFNPYIIAEQYTTSNRVEVHLPLKDMTSAADKTLMNGDNAYYVGAGGIYPFAINIPITGFKVADERNKIDAEGQYPSFKEWATSKGEKNEDWYLQDKGKK